MPTDPSAPAALPLDVAARLIFDHLPVPLCVLDGAQRIVAMNPAAERFWGMRVDEVAGTEAADVLGVRPLQNTDDPVSPLQQAVDGTTERVPCRITGRDGLTHVAALVGMHLQQGGYAAIGVTAEQTAPAWAFIDPVTGIPNRLSWERERERWGTMPGAAILFDLDDLKEINDLYGHRAGDQALATVGQALRETLPEQACALRWGGDEFLVLVADASLNEAQRLAASVKARADELGQTALPLRPVLSFGTATFAPGDLAAGVHRADDALYEAKGVLLRAASGARLVLTREGRRMVRAYRDPPSAPPANYAGRFTSAFDAQFRAIFERAAEEARRFVAFAAPPPGGAVVELGAGSGRLTLDGGLAERVGPHGHLLVTDPSDAQLRVMRQRLGTAALPWVHIMRAPAEALPLASGCADMAVGAMFLHFTDPERTLREIARVLSPGGRLALASPLPFAWPAFWREVLEPVAAAARPLGLPSRHWAVPEDEILTATTAAGFHLEARAHVPDRGTFPSSAVATAFFQQTHAVTLMLPGAPAAAVEAAEQDVLARITERWEAYGDADRTTEWVQLHLTARKL